MGAATARMFAREGAKVVIADVLEHEGEQVAQGIGASARFELLDVTKEESWAAVVAATIREFGTLDILVNNAGISGSAEQDFYSTEAWHRIMAVNATGVFFGMKCAMPAMVANGSGSIVNLSSIAGVIGSNLPDTTETVHDPSRTVFPAIEAGALYAIIVFLIDFILGIIRVLLLAPRLGETTAVIIEAPIMLAASWFVCRWCVD